MSRPVHFEIHGDDPVAATRFYSAVFDWKVEQWGDQPYWLYTTGEDGPGIDGAAAPSEDHGQKVVLTVEVDDLAAACLKVLSLSADQYRALSAVRSDDSDSIDIGPAVSPKVSHINVGTGHDLTIRRLAALVKSTVGFEGRELWDQTKPDGSPQKLLDVTRLKSTGWKPQIELSDGIRKTYDWYLEQNA